MVKTEDEINKLIASSKLADDCFTYICSAIRIGMTEIEVANLIDNFFMSNGASRIIF